VAVSIPRVALSIDEAAAALGVSRAVFTRHVEPDIRIIQIGQARLVTVRDLERWAATA
jgi:hypothetical protein